MSPQLGYNGACPAVEIAVVFGGELFELDGDFGDCFRLDGGGFDEFAPVVFGRVFGFFGAVPACGVGRRKSEGLGFGEE